MSPRHEPTKLLRLDRLTWAGSQSRSQFAGFGRLFGQLFFLTRQSTNAGPSGTTRRTDAVDVPGRRLEVDELRLGRRRVQRERE